MKTKQWIVVASASRAFIVSEEQPGQSLTLVRVLRHPEGRQPAAALVTDRPSSAPGRSGGSSAMSPRLDPHRNALEHFATQLANDLDHSLRRREVDQLTIVAANPFYGVLLKHLSPALRKAVTRFVEHDFIDLPLDQLRMRLDQT